MPISYDDPVNSIHYRMWLSLCRMSQMLITLAIMSFLGFAWEHSHWTLSCWTTLSALEDAGWYVKEQLGKAFLNFHFWPDLCFFHDAAAFVECCSANAFLFIFSMGFLFFKAKVKAIQCIETNKWINRIQGNKLFLFSCFRIQGFRARCCAWLSLLFVIGAAIRMLLAVKFNIKMPPPIFDHVNMRAPQQDIGFFFYHVLYFATPSRICNFASGSLLACLLQDKMTSSEGGEGRTNNPRVGVSYVFNAIVGLYVWHILSRSYSLDAIGTWEAGCWWAALAYHGSPLLSILFCLLIISCIISSDRITMYFRRILECAALSYIGKVRSTTMHSL